MPEPKILARLGDLVRFPMPVGEDKPPLEFTGGVVTIGEGNVEVKYIWTVVVGPNREPISVTRHVWIDLADCTVIYRPVNHVQDSPAREAQLEQRVLGRSTHAW